MSAFFDKREKITVPARDVRVGDWSTCGGFRPTVEVRKASNRRVRIVHLIHDEYEVSTLRGRDEPTTVYRDRA